MYLLSYNIIENHRKGVVSGTYYRRNRTEICMETFL